MAYSMNGEWRNVYMVLMAEPEIKPLGEPKRTCV
jgi:hypothetical protein